MRGGLKRRTLVQGKLAEALVRYPHRYPLFAGLERSAVRRQEPESPALARVCGL